MVIMALYVYHYDVMQCDVCHCTIVGSMAASKGVRTIYMYGDVFMQQTVGNEVWLVVVQ